MIISRIRERVSGLSEMHALINQFLAFSPVIHEKPNIMRDSFPISPQIRIFHGSKLSHGTKVSPAESSQVSPSVFANRVSRSARTEAQVVLFDYLHCTRNFSFTDAEHISKNSPHFIQNLLSKIDSEKDVTRCLAKFLRYNPINEFEPFFESLGLSPPEVTPLLPRQLMFLTDDSIMFENYLVLCNYGIPRSEIGKMYKESREIFRYDYGMLASKLQAYENLGLSKPTVIKLVSCCPSLLIGGVDCKFVLVLEKLRGLGIKHDWIGGHLSTKRTFDFGRILDTIEFLDKVGYSEDQLGDLLKRYPALVLEGSGKKVHVLFGRLLKLGLRMNGVYSLLMKNPEILSVKCAKNLFQAVDFLLDIGMGTGDIANMVSNHMELIGSCSLKGPKTVCKHLKVGKSDLCQIIKEEPLKFFSLASKSKVKSNELLVSQDSSKRMEKIAFLFRLGYVENSDGMLKALRQFRGRGDQLQERFECLIKAGLDSNVVTNIIKQAPMVLNQSRDVIERKIHFLINCLGYPLESVVAFPTYLCYDMERINHRFSMYMWLREQGAAKPMLSLSTILACSDARFVKYFVNVHPEGPAMWESLKRSSTSS